MKIFLIIPFGVLTYITINAIVISKMSLTILPPDTTGLATYDLYTLIAIMLMIGSQLVLKKYNKVWYGLDSGCIASSSLDESSVKSIDLTNDGKPKSIIKAIRLGFVVT